MKVYESSPILPYLNLMEIDPADILNSAGSIYILLDSGDNDGWDINLDLIATTVPEPSRAFLMGLGAVSLLFLRRRA